MFGLVSKDQIKEVLLDIAADMKDVSNPRNELNDCLYRGEDGSRCIAGHIVATICGDAIADSLLTEQVSFDATAASRLFEQDASDLVAHMQVNADRQGATWGDAILSAISSRTLEI